MTLVKVNKRNTDGNTTNRNLSPVFDPEFGMTFPNLFDTFTRPFFRRNLLDDFFDDNMNLTMANIGTSIPAVNIEETDTDLIINVAAPGMNKKDFIVEVNNNQLHIGYKKQTQQESNQ